MSYLVCQALVETKREFLYCSISGFSRINGFHCLNYADERGKLSHIGDKVCTFKFKEKPVTIHYGADSTEKFEYLDWKEHCNKFLKNFYTSDGQFIEVITVPTTVKETKMTGFWTRAMNTLKNWCSSSSNGLGLVVANHDIVHNLELLGVKEDDMKEILIKKELQGDRERLIVFNVVENIIFVVRKGSDNLQEKVINCIDDVNLLTLLLKEELNHSGVRIAGLLVQEESCANKHRTEKCSRCKNFIVPPEIFETPEIFWNFWLNFKNRKKLDDTDVKAINAKQLLQDVASKIVGYMSRHNPGILPKLVENDLIKTIEQAEMLMDRYQMEIAYSKKRRVILQGDYGSGKTVIVLKKMQLLLKTMQNNEAVYYISFSAKSELHHAIKQKLKRFCELNQNVKVVQGGQNLSSIVESNILPEEKKIGTKNIHLFVDEFSSEKLSISEIAKLNKIFAEGTLFQNATVLIATQPIKIDRHMVFGTGFGKTVEQGYWFQGLKNFEVYHLKYVMRTTVQVNTLAKITQDYLNYKSNEYNHHQEFLSELLSENAENSYITKKKSFKIKRVLIKIGKPLRKFISKTDQQTPSSSNNISKDAASDRIPARFDDSDSTLPLSKEIPDYDELHKLASFRNNEGSENNHKMLTTYAYTCPSKIGHGIDGPLPEIIELVECVNPTEQVGLIGIMLKKKLESLKLKEIVIIHFEPSDSFWLKSLFKLPKILPSLKVTTDLDSFSENHNNNLILVKNYNSVKGLEFSNVLLVVDANEYYLKQFIPEAMTRCQSNLSVLIKPREKENYKIDVVIDLVNCWNQINSEEEKPIIRTLKLQFCPKTRCSIKEDHEEECCLEKLESGAIVSYKVHKNCQTYKRLLEEIKVTNELQDGEEKKEKAIAM